MISDTLKPFRLSNGITVLPDAGAQVFMAVLEPEHKPVPVTIRAEHCAGKVTVEVLNEMKRDGKFDYTNTDQYGATEICLRSALTEI